jgi:multiple sugar transport system substrate-binding protein
MSKRTLLSAFAVLLVLGLVACGGPAPTEAPAEEEEAAPPAAEEEKVELRFWMHQNPAFIAADEEVIRQFEAEHPNVTIKMESFEYDLFIQTLQTAMPAGTEGDIIEMFGTWVCSYADGGRLAEMPESVMSRSEAEELFFAAPLQGYDCSGKLYGLPNEFNIENGAVLVNPAMFEAAGLEYPPTWDTTEDLLSDAQKLTQFDGDVMTVAGYDFVTGDGLAFQLLAGILQRGGDYWKPDQSGLQLDTPEARETLEWMKSLVDEYKVVDPVLFNDDSNWVGDAFFSDQTAIGFVGPWAAAEGLTEYPDFEFDYVAIPNYAGDKPYFAADAGWGKVVSVNSEHKDIAWEFVKFATANADNAKIYNVASGTVPALKSVADDPALLDDLPWIAADLPILQYGRFIGPLPDRDLFWYDIVYPHVLGVLQDTETIDEALVAMDAEANAMFE